MALLKNKTLENGIVTQYHRIVSLNIIVNQTCIIEVASYINEDYRKEDIPSEKPKNIFINTTYYNVSYNETMSIEKAYEYLKTLDEFKDASDC